MVHKLDEKVVRWILLIVFIHHVDDEHIYGLVLLLIAHDYEAHCFLHLPVWPRVDCTILMIHGWEGRAFLVSGHRHP